MTCESRGEKSSIKLQIKANYHTFESVAIPSWMKTKGKERKSGANTMDYESCFSRNKISLCFVFVRSVFFIDVGFEATHKSLLKKGYNKLHSLNSQKRVNSNFPRQLAFFPHFPRAKERKTRDFPAAHNIVVVAACFSAFPISLALTHSTKISRNQLVGWRKESGKFKRGNEKKKKSIYL